MKYSLNAISVFVHYLYSCNIALTSIKTKIYLSPQQSNYTHWSFEPVVVACLVANL